MYRTVFKQEHKDDISEKLAHVFKLVFCKILLTDYHVRHRHIA